MTLLDTALDLHNAGLAPLPIKPDGSKAPAVTWKNYTTTRAGYTHVETWFTNTDTDGIGTITGAPAGALEMLELEARAVTEDLLPQLTDALHDHGLHDLWARINSGWVEATPTGGIHWHYRISDGPARPNTKLARRPATPHELLEKPGDKVKVLIETRGQGGFTVLAPSAGRTHRTGQSWTRLHGDPTTCPTISSDERDALYAIASTLDALPAVAAPTPRTTPPRQAGDPLRPGDDYNQRATWDDILTPHGWTRTRHFGGSTYGWRRPGKTDPGISATTGRNDGDNLYVFSSSTPFDTETPYSKFGAITLLHHGGDYTSAARALAAEGYGDKQPISSTPHNVAELIAPTPDVGNQRENMPADIPAARHLTAVDGNTVRVVEPLTATRLATGYGPTQDGTARALADLHHTNLRYCPQRGMWLSWTGSRWSWDYSETHREHVRALARELPEGEGWRKHKAISLSSAGVTGIARLAQSDPRLNVHIDQLDANPYQLNTPAGIIDLRTGALTPAIPEALHTRTTTVAPDFDQPSDLLNRFLDTTFGGNPDLIGYIQRLAGLSVIGTVLEQILPFGLGTGANGKTTLTEALEYTLGRGDGGYSMSAPSEMLMARKHSEHPAELAQLAGARLVICSELDDGQRFAEARIKQLTGRDSINARFMRKDPFTFRPSHTIWLLGNHKPNATAGGPAFWRRVQLIPFENVVPVHQRDGQLGEKLEQEAPAILAWLARGAADYMTGGLRVPALVKAATEQYAHDQDSIGRFVDERCHLAPDNPLVVQIKVGDLRTAYEQWCHDNGDTPVSAKRLTQDLRDRWNVDTNRTMSARFYGGVSLLTDDEPGPDRWGER